MAQKEYEDVESITGLAHIRKRPGMYVGAVTSDNDKNPRALLQISQEAISNGTDEALNGYGENITMTIHTDNSMTITDEGRGLPMGKDFDSVIRAFTVPGTSGKFGGEDASYSSSGGLNGMGLKGITALSTEVTCQAVTSVGDAYEITFQQEEVVSKKSRKAKPGEKTGTTITFHPDDTVFDTINWDLEELKMRMDNQSYLAPGVTYTVIDERLDVPVNDTEDDSEEETENVEKQPATFVYRHDEGMKDLVANYADGNEMIGSNEPLRFFGYYDFIDKKPVGYLSDKNDATGEVIGVELSLVYTEDIGENIITFANGIPNYEGGPHKDGAVDAVNRIINDFAVDRKLIKSKAAKEKMSKDDTTDGLVMAISVTIPESMAEYEGQMKEKLATSQAKIAVEETLMNHFAPWLYDNEAKAKKIVEKIKDAKGAREAAKAAREDMKAARKTGGRNKNAEISKKLKPALSKDRLVRELFIVEGDSAGGSAYQARNGQTQGVLPLRGKPLNIYGKRLSTILKNEEIRTLINVLGAGVGKDFERDKLEYNKIVIMADADDDGKHITELLVLIFYKLFPGLIQNGHVYIANAPLFRFDKYIKGKREKHFALDVEEYTEMAKQYGDYNVTRMKGLGEMSFEDLKFTTMNAGTRTLTQISEKDAKDTMEKLTLFLGDQKIGSMSPAEARYAWIKENVDFRVSDQEIPV